MFGVVNGVNYYGCCKCQAQHFEGESLYQEHLMSQSKHGIQQVSREEYEGIQRSAANPELKTPKTHPEHADVGHDFKGWSIQDKKPTTYYCDSYDPTCGFWMTNRNDPSDRRNISERAIGRTFHEVYI